MKLADLPYGRKFVYLDDPEQQWYMKVDRALFVVSHPVWRDDLDSIIPDCLIVNCSNGVICYEFGDQTVEET